MLEQIFVQEFVTC